MPGTTSACAENTWAYQLIQNQAGNYLRVRGEYNIGVGLGKYDLELPPRARRIRTNQGRTVFRVGTTSACAENTSATTARTRAMGNYLRVRGEYHLRSLMTCHLRELPPRARRIRSCCSDTIFCRGTTSACAENTPFLSGRFG